MTNSPVRPVLIVGAGPTGIVLAIELARRGLPFHLIDRRSGPVHWSQAIFIKSRTLEILAALGLRDQFYDIGQVVTKVEVYSDEAKRASYDFHGLDTPFPHILSVPEEDTIRLLTDSLEALGGEIEFGVELTALCQEKGHVVASLGSTELGDHHLEASYVVGTDGFHSATRRVIADEFDGIDYPDLWGVFDTHLSNWSHQRDTLCAQLAAPIAIQFPLGEERWRVYFRTERAKDDVLTAVVKRLRVLSPDVDLVHPGEPQFFHSHSRLARNFRIGRVFLAGDAAHASNPIDGHGMNMGIQDSYNLGWKLALMTSGRATDDLVNSYQAERRPVDQMIVKGGDEAYARMMPSGADGLESLFAFLSTPDGREFAAVAESEIGLGYDQSPILGEIGTRSADLPYRTNVGYRVGDVQGLLHAGQPCCLHELLTGTNSVVFLLLGASPLPDVVEAIHNLEADIRDTDWNLDVHVVARSAVETTFRGGVVLDPEGLLHKRLGSDLPTLCLIRPDGHLGLCCAPPSTASLKAHLGRMCL